MLRLMLLLRALVFSRIVVPLKNTGGANVSAFKAMPIPHHLRQWLE